MTESTYEYEGSELTLFAAATNWKAYWSAQVAGYIKGSALEVGAGMGTNTALLAHRATDWTCLEPDAQLSAEISRKIVSGSLPPHCRVITGTLANLDPGYQADTILYIDVMEHIADDGEEMARVASRLRRGGHLIVLSPAHQWLFSPFDAAIGHHRRYSRNSMLALTQPGLRPVTVRYLDSCGLLASAANRWLLSASMPNARQIKFWDSVLVRMSRAADPVTAFSLGKTVIGVWTRD